MAFQIFISYARDDDIAPPELPQAKGFVANLRDQLEYNFKGLGQPRPKFWEDTRIQNAEQFGPIIVRALEESELLLFVLSRNSIKREWCMKELEHFANRWGDRAKERIVVVHKHHVPREEHPPLAQGQEGYRFFATDSDAKPGFEVEYFERGEVRNQKYYEQINSLSRFLWTRQSETELSPSGTSAETLLIPSLLGPDLSETPDHPNGRTVFVAKPAADMQQAYHRLIRELAGRGYAVSPSPNEEIPNDSSAKEFIEQALSVAEASVHLLGEGAGYAPEEQSPIVKLQLSLAAQCASDDAFRRIIWAPKQLARSDADTESIERDPLAVLDRFDKSLSTDKIEGGYLTKFIEFLVRYLNQSGVRQLAMQSPLDADGKVYIYHSSEDTEYALTLASVFESRNVTPILPALEGDPAELSAFHARNLKNCDAVILCWAASSEVWMRSRAAELGDWHTLGRAAPFSCRGLVAGPPPGQRKSVYVRLPPRTEIDVVIDLTKAGQPSPEVLQPLLS